jgi:5'-deoxynucleotidase YfbR-like HD superfamily hydrolase
MAIVLHSKLEIPVHLETVLMMVVVHDLAEVNAGDYHAFNKVPKHKHDLEKKALKN